MLLALIQTVIHLLRLHQHQNITRKRFLVSFLSTDSELKLRWIFSGGDLLTHELGKLSCVDFGRVTSPPHLLSVI